MIGNKVPKLGMLLLASMLLIAGCGSPGSESADSANEVNEDSTGPITFTLKKSTMRLISRNKPVLNFIPFLESATATALKIPQATTTRPDSWNKSSPAIRMPKRKLWPPTKQQPGKTCSPVKKIFPSKNGGLVQHAGTDRR